MRKDLLFIILFCVYCAARGQTKYNYRYWFDNDISTMSNGTSTEDAWTIEADVSALSESLHSFHVQIEDSEGILSSPLTRYFLKSLAHDNVNVQYWFDNDYSTLTTGSVNDGKLLVDVSQLTDGYHVLHTQVVGDFSGVSSPKTNPFIKIPQVEGVEYLTCLCMIDDNLYKQEQVPSSGGVVSWSFDVSSLSQGFHRMFVQVLTPSGAATSAQQAFFFRAPTSVEYHEMKCVYCIDGGEFNQEAGVLADGTYHFDLDVSSIEDGLHRITYMLSDGKGVSTKAQTQFFTKTPLGGNGIKEYRYWLNEQSDAEAKKVVLPERQEPFSLITLLPVESQPLRSKSFQFRVKDNQPTIYAKNDIHIRFYDAAGRFTDVSKQYVDESVSEEVTTAGVLQASQSFDRVEENKIRWYSFASADGDTIAFKASQACSIQVFSPSGEEIYSASGPESVQFGGCHTWEDGEYYLALHDVTGSQSYMTLDYMHMDQYDVVAQDVSVVGNGGCSTITFSGNGFRDLYAVDLYNAQGDTIHRIDIGHESDATTSVTFDFTGAALGQYSALFHFTEEDKTFLNLITVEEAVDIELATDVSFPATFLSGTSTTYTVKITNKGNMTAYQVPLEMIISSEGSAKDIQLILFTDEAGNKFNTYSTDYIEKDSIDEETLAYLERTFQGLKGLQSFIVVNDSLEGDFAFSDLLVTIPPNSDTKFNVTIKTDYTISLNVRIPSEWITITTQANSLLARGRRASSENGFCCEKEKWECAVNIVANIIGVIPVAGCGSSLADETFFTAFEIACAGGNSVGEKVDNFFRSIANDKGKKKSVIDRTINSIISCVSGAIGKAIAAVLKKLNETKKLRAAALAANSAALAERDASLSNAALLTKQGDAAAKVGKYDEAKIFWDQADVASKNADTFGRQATDYYNKATIYADEISSYEQEIDKLKEQLQNAIGAIKNGVDAMVSGSECVQEWKKAKENCPPNPGGGGGTSTPQPPVDPNDIYGYLSEAGSKFITDSVAKVNYTIEFENDAEFAKASAHTIVVKDTLDSRYFDLQSFLPTSVKLGEREVFLDEVTDVKTENGITAFVKSIDVRPEIDAIAQVKGTYNQKTGIATWTFTSLDPMTMEPTNDLMQGILPVNYNGTSGIGEVMFEIGVKSGKSDGTEIPNRAGIVFDYEDPILTPTWVNTVDAVAPTSQVTACELKNDSTATLYFEGRDEKSGVWKYDVYVQYEDNTSWYKCVEGVTDSKCDVKIIEGMNHGFYVIATDSAGNREVKEPAREYTLDIFDNMEDSYLDIELAQGWNWISHNLNYSIDIPKLAKSNRLVSQTEELYNDKVFGWVGKLNMLKPGIGYKIQMEEADELEMEGKLYQSSYKSIKLYEGWNWIGYPLAHEMEIEQALAKFAPEEGDYIVGQDGFTQYVDGQWVGTITTLIPGKGYLYKSGSDTQLFFNGDATMSARAEVQGRKAMSAEPWTCDKYKYPNVMPITANIFDNGNMMNADDYYIGAFCGAECRGIGKTVKGKLMMSVYGESGETITFLAMQKDSEQLFNIVESNAFTSDVLGSFSRPYQLNIGDATNIDVLPMITSGDGETYDTSGRKVERSQKGINIIDGKKVMVK